MKKYFIQSQILICCECWRADLPTFFNEEWKCFTECKCGFVKEIEASAEMQRKINIYLQHLWGNSQGGNLSTDDMIWRIYELLDKHTELRIWDILQRMDKNDYKKKTCPRCYRHISFSKDGKIFCRKCVDRWLIMRETCELLLDLWTKKSEILENQTPHCIKMIFKLLTAK